MFEDALKDSWAYQEIWQGGKQEGKQEERVANLQRQRHMLEYLVEQDFPALLPLAKKRGEASDDPDVLQDIILRLLRAGGKADSEPERLDIRESGMRGGYRRNILSANIPPVASSHPCDAMEYHPFHPEHFYRVKTGDIGGVGN